MGKVCLFVICMYCSIHHLSAQQEEQQTQPVQQPLVTQDDILGNMNVDYAKIKLPPLSVLYENARSTPSLQILEKEKQLQKKLLSKEKRNWLGFIHAGGSASYGIADNVASNTDVNTPLIYRYVGTEQTSWNVGGGISIPFEKLFDLRGGIKRQRIQVDIAELRKQEVNPEKPDVPLNKNDAFQKVQKRRVQENGERGPIQHDQSPPFFFHLNPL